jgi:hypothetical protein
MKIENNQITFCPEYHKKMNIPFPEIFVDE